MGPFGQDLARSQENAIRGGPVNRKKTGSQAFQPFPPEGPSHGQGMAAGALFPVGGHRPDLGNSFERPGQGYDSFRLHPIVIRD